mmetsp:Transcript_20753/g.38922  ORF Transcript_20753/g.38922 Transcript_20753/m.38922 type:complete len:81 (+) Transcript_20753:292-534(+)
MPQILATSKYKKFSTLNTPSLSITPAFQLFPNSEGMLESWIPVIWKSCLHLFVCHIFPSTPWKTWMKQLIIKWAVKCCIL